MSDIVERLKYHTATLDRPLCCEAAAEIERLRAALQELAGDAYHDDDYQVIARRALERK